MKNGYVVDADVGDEGGDHDNECVRARGECLHVVRAPVGLLSEPTLRATRRRTPEMKGATARSVNLGKHANSECVLHAVDIKHAAIRSVQVLPRDLAH